jgi:hypothetical protein
MKFCTPALPLGAQMHQMEQAFPGFRYQREQNIPSWYGHLRPFEDSNSYLVKIEYHFANNASKRPRVRVVSPKLVSNAPHIFPDQSLCLYFPPDQTWTAQKAISEIIVPLTAAWLAFYEIWLSTGVWYGPEAPHGRKKK